MRKHLILTPATLQAQRPDLPHVLEQCIAHLLGKDLHDRYRSAETALHDMVKIRAAYNRGEREPALVIGGADAKRVLADPQLVGRQQELAVLHTHYAKAAMGQGGLVLLEGESGGGKSRLMEEFHPAGAWILRGLGSDQSAQRPFQILSGWVSAIQQRIRQEPTFGARLRAALASHAAAICNALPELKSVLGATENDTDLGPEAFGEMRSLQALMALIEALGTEDTPCLLTVDDCQWADDLSLKLIQFWQQRDEVHPPQPRFAMMLVAFRSEEVHPGHRLRYLKHFTSIQLQPFAAQDTRQIAESMAGPLPDDIFEPLQTLSQGNPFMIAAIMHGLIEVGALTHGATGWQTDKQALREVGASRKAGAFLAKRLSRFPASTLQMLSVGAVIGKEFDVDMVAMLANTSSMEVTAYLQGAQNARVLWADQDGTRFTFVHDKIRETVLSLLSEGARKDLHRAVAAYWQARDPHQIFELAYHFSEAGQHHEALPYAIEAGVAARARHALQICEKYFRIAEQGVAPDDRMNRQVICEGLGDVFMLLGKYDEAEARFEQARGLCDTPESLSNIEGKLGELAFKRGDVGVAANHVRRALQAIGRTVPQGSAACLLMLAWEIAVQTAHCLLPRWLVGRRHKDRPGAHVDFLAARLYSRLAYISWFGKGMFQCAWSHLRGLNLCETYPASLELAQAYSEHAPVMTMIPWFSRGIRYVEKSLEIRRSFNDLWGEGQSLSFFGVVLFGASRYEESLQRCLQAIHILERTGDRWEMSTASWHVAFIHYHMGNLKESFDWSCRTYKASLDVGDYQAAGICLGGWAKATDGRVPQENIVATEARTTDDVHTRAELGQAEALRLLREGQIDAAIVCLRATQQIIDAGGTRNAYVMPVAVQLLTALRRKLETTPTYAGAVKKALLQDMRRAMTAAHRRTRWFKNCRPHFLRERAYFEAAVGQPHRAYASLQASLGLAKEHGARLDEAQTLLAWADIGTALGWPDALSHQQRGRALMASIEAPLEALLHEGEAASAVVQSPSLVDRFSNILGAAHDIAAALDHNALYAAVQQATLVLLRGESCCIIEVDGAEERVVWPIDARGPLQTGSANLVQRALRCRKPVIYGDLELEEQADLADVRSALCAPICASNGVQRCLYIAHSRLRHLFGEQEITLVEFITTLASAALDNVEGFAQVQSLSEERQRLYEKADSAVRSRDEFLSIAAHEMKTPITSLMLQADGIARTVHTRGVQSIAPERFERFFALHSRQLRALRRLIDDLFDVSRITTGHLTLHTERVDLCALVHDVVDRSRETLNEAGCCVEVACLPDVVATVDRTRIEQVIGNLLNNAVKYAAGTPVHVSLTTTDGMAELRVRDEGPGIALEKQGRIFERFERATAKTSIGGLGLGLFIVAEILRAHGGSIRLESTPGAGAEFVVALPLGAH